LRGKKERKRGRRDGVELGWVELNGGIEKKEDFT